MKKGTFDKEYKIQAVELCLEGNKPKQQKNKVWLTTFFSVG